MTAMRRKEKSLAKATKSLTLEALPADEGDCLILTCRSASKTRHVLIDGGTPATADRLREQLRGMPAGSLALMVVTHIDSDHIGGIVRLLREPGFRFEVGDVWFNGFKHLPRNAAVHTRALKDAEELTQVLVGASGPNALPWNVAFKEQAVMRPEGQGNEEVAGELPSLTFPWGLRVTLLSPTPDRLDALYTGWNRYLNDLRAERREAAIPAPPRPRAGLDLEALAAHASKEDTAAPNGSSIALLAEFGGRTCLLGADAHPSVLAPALRRLAATRPKLLSDTKKGAPVLGVDILKLPHHGSRANVMNELFDVVRADHYVVSTNGNRFNHPDDEGMARVITRGGPGHTLWFNYRCPRTVPWDNAEWKQRYGYSVRYPERDDTGVSITLSGR